MFNILYIIPKNLLSFLVGKFAVIRMPAFFNQPFLRWFASRYGVDLSEAEFPLSSYTSLSRFFLRNLRANARPISEGIVSPVDARIDQKGVIESGTLIQAKGKTYSAAALLGDDKLASHFEGGSFVTFYLAPGDYHHIHSPLTGKIIRSILIEGSLWPVNPWSVNRIDGLFCVNERIVTVIESDLGKVAVVKVGATNVGAITTTYNDFRGNLAPFRFRNRNRIVSEEFSPGIHVDTGQKIASFRLGSTVILLLPRGMLDISDFGLGVIKYGSALTRSARNEMASNQQAENR